MRLIERVMQSGPSAAVDQRAEVNINGHSSPVDVESNIATPEPPVEDGIERIGQAFRLDSRGLAQRGFVTPRTLASQLGREMSSIKRRLLRRLEFFNRPDEAGAPAQPGRNVVLVTSPKPGDGKTFTAINLALILALEDEVEVLVIDADLHASKVAGGFGIDAKRGLSERLRDPALPLAECLFREERLPITVMPAGKRPRSAASLFGESEMTLLMHEVARRYRDRLVIIDGPPLLATTEAAVLVPHADEIVLVVRSGDATHDSVTSALDAIGDDNKISIVLNRSPTADAEAKYATYYRATES